MNRTSLKELVTRVLALVEGLKEDEKVTGIEIGVMAEDSSQVCALVRTYKPKTGLEVTSRVTPATGARSDWQVDFQISGDGTIPFESPIMIHEDQMTTEDPTSEKPEESEEEPEEADSSTDFVLTVFGHAGTFEPASANFDCPICDEEITLQWADDPESDLADWWECENCGCQGALVRVADPTLTVNGIPIARCLECGKQAAVIYEMSNERLDHYCKDHDPHLSEPKTRLATEEDLARDFGPGNLLIGVPVSPSNAEASSAPAPPTQQTTAPGESETPAQ